MPVGDESTLDIFCGTFLGKFLAMMMGRMVLEHGDMHDFLRWLKVGI